MFELVIIITNTLTLFFHFGSGCTFAVLHSLCKLCFKGYKHWLKKKSVGEKIWLTCEDTHGGEGVKNQLQHVDVLIDRQEVDASGHFCFPSVQIFIDTLTLYRETAATQIGTHQLEIDTKNKFKSEAVNKTHWNDVGDPRASSLNGSLYH